MVTSFLLILTSLFFVIFFYLVLLKLFQLNTYKLGHQKILLISTFSAFLTQFYFFNFFNIIFIKTCIVYIGTFFLVSEFLSLLYRGFSLNILLLILQSETVEKQLDYDFKNQARSIFFSRFKGISKCYISKNDNLELNFFGNLLHLLLKVLKNILVEKS